MLRTMLGTAAAAIAVLLAAPAAHAYSYGQTSCGYDPNLAQADQALRTATDTAIYMQQNLSNAYSYDGSAVPAAVVYLTRADQRYRQAKNADDQIRASDEAACRH